MSAYKKKFQTIILRQSEIRKHNYERPVSKIIPFEIFYIENLKKKPTCRLLEKNKNRTHTLRRIFSLHTKSLNPSPYTVHSEVDFRELNVRKDEVDKARASPENATSYFWNNFSLNKVQTKSVLSILELNWNQRFRDGKSRKVDKLSSPLFVDTTAKLRSIHVVERKRTTCYEMYKNKKRHAHVQRVQSYVQFVALSNMQIHAPYSHASEVCNSEKMSYH